MTAMSIQEQDAYFLRQAVIHSCGRAFVSRHFGMNGSPSIWRNTGDNLAEEKLWLSSMTYEGWNGTLLRDRRIAIAGFIAVEMDCEGSPEESCVESLSGSLGDWLGDEWGGSDEMSRSEWDILVSCKDRDIHSVYMVLKRNWKALLAEAEFLMVEAVEHGSSTTTAWGRSQGFYTPAD